MDMWNNRFATSIVAAASLALAAFAAPAEAAQPGTIVNESTGQQCTIAYVNKQLSRAYTAGHCGSTGDRMSAFGTKTTFTAAGHRGEQDWGYVSVPRIKLLAFNQSAWSETPPHTGDRVCYQSKRHAKRCGTVLTTSDSIFTTTPAAAGVPGDSGSPAFANHKLAGIYTGIQVAPGGGLEAVFIRLPKSEWEAHPRMALSSLSSSRI